MGQVWTGQNGSERDGTGRDETERDGSKTETETEQNGTKHLSSTSIQILSNAHIVSNVRNLIPQFSLPSKHIYTLKSSRKPYSIFYYSYTLYPTHYTSRHTPYTLHPSPNTPHLTAYTPRPTPYTLHPQPKKSNTQNRTE